MWSWIDFTLVEKLCFSWYDNKRCRNAEGNNPAIVTPVVLTFEIRDTKLFVPVVTLSKENDAKHLGQLKWGFKSIKLNK